MKDIVKINKLPQDFSMLIKCVTQTIENESKEQRFGSLGILLLTLSACLLGYMLGGKE